MPQFIPPKWQNQPISCAFASDLDSFVERSGALLWVHGHIHSQSDYQIRRTRVIANPRGYPGEEVGDFKPGLVIEV